MIAIKPEPVITVGSSQYHIQATRTWLPPKLIEKIARYSESAFVPVTAVAWAKDSFEEQDLRTTFSSFASQDDVWCHDFDLVTLLLRTSEQRCKVLCRRTYCLRNTEGKLPEGPLVVEKATGHIFLVAKLVQDTNAAFVSAIVPGSKPSGSFLEFPPENDSLSDTPTSEVLRRNVIKIALPSRLYFNPSKEHPLAGIRIGVKDTIALKGLRTGFGSQAWRESHKAETFTAPCVLRLIDAGAIVVGKLVTSEFAEGVEPSEWVQGVCPYNPRGDGQQKPSSSSTGSAVAAAAYSWLDITIGTDTGGSIRHPAGVNGLFGQRPTSGSVDLTGVLGATDLFNTVGIFARSAELFTRVGSYLLDPTLRSLPGTFKRKYNLLYPTRTPPNSERHHGSAHRWFPHPEADVSSWTEAEKMIDKVVAWMESEFECQRIPFNINDVWRATPPKGQPRSLDEATGQIYGDITTSSACATGIDQFLADYRLSHHGQEPAMGEMVRRRLEYGRHLPKEKVAAALEAAASFKNWMETTLFGSYDQDATTLMIFPQSCGTPDYRDGTSRWDGNLFIEVFSIYAFGYLCGCPDYTIPVGEVPYHSLVSGQTEYLPVSMSLVGKPGTDQELFDVVTHLHQKGIVTDVEAGSRMYVDDKKTGDVMRSI